jgi:hypothetical protein
MQDSKPRHFEYWMRYRPPGYATVPAGYIALLPPDRDHPFGGVVYDRSLNRADIENYELHPVDPRHPINLKASFERFRDVFINKMSDQNETYRINSDYLVTPSTIPDIEWQLTMFDKGMPTGHEDYDDFDVLARRIWGIEWLIQQKAEKTATSEDDTSATLSL